MNNFALSGALATAPSSAFAELRERPRFWFPLLIVVVSTVALVAWYYNIVDVDWLKDAMFGNNPNMKPEQRAAAISMMTRTTFLWSGVVGVCLVIPVILLIQALVLFLTAKVTKVPLGFKHWFAMSSWVSLTGLLGTVVAALLLIMSDTSQIGPGVLASLSINELLLHRPMGSPGEGWFQAINIPALLSWILMIIGVRTWSQRGWSFSAAFVLVPIVAIYGLWAFISFR